MRKNLFCFVFLLNTLLSFGQINIGSPGAIKPSDFSKKDYGLFQASTTFFIIRENDKEILPQIESILREVWKFNKYEIIDFDKYKSIAKNPNCLFFGLRSYNRSFDYVSNADLFGKYTQSTELFIELWRNTEVEKENHIYEQVLAYVDCGTPWSVTKILGEKVNIDAFEYICKGKEVYKEWNWGLLKNYLQEINRCMVDNKPRWKFASGYDKENIGKLNSETLYVVENVKDYYDTREKKSPFEIYAGKKIEMISIADLGEKILTSEKPFYYMFVYKNSNDKMTTIINSKTGKFLYSDYKGLSYFFKDKDVKELNGKLD